MVGSLPRKQGKLNNTHPDILLIRVGVYNLGERGQQVTQCSRSRGRKGTISCDTSDEQNLAQSEDGGSAPEELEPQDVQKGFRLEGRVGAKRAVEGAQG